MKLGREVVEHGNNVGRQGSLAGPFLAEGVRLGLCRDVTRAEKPEEAFWERLLASFGLRQLGLAFRDSVASKPVFGGFKYSIGTLSNFKTYKE